MANTCTHAKAKRPTPPRELKAPSSATSPNTGLTNCFGLTYARAASLKQHSRCPWSINPHRGHLTHLHRPARPRGSQQPGPAASPPDPAPPPPAALTLLVHQPHEEEAGHEADGPPEDEQGDVPAAETEGQAGRVLDGAPAVPHQALREAQQREQQQHQPPPPVHAARGRRQPPNGNRHGRAPRRPPRLRPPLRCRWGRRGPQERLPLLRAAPA